MPFDARIVANVILDIAASSGEKLTHLKLQKILFFAHAWALAKNKIGLIGQPFEAWQYGPVLRVIYDQLKHFGSQPIEVRLKKLNVKSGEFEYAYEDIAIDCVKLLKDVYGFYGRYHAGELVDLTHEAGSPWDEIWKKAVDKPSPGMFISNESIMNWILREGRGEEISNH